MPEEKHFYIISIITTQSWELWALRIRVDSGLLLCKEINERMNDASYAYTSWNNTRSFPRTDEITF